MFSKQLRQYARNGSALIQVVIIGAVLTGSLTFFSNKVSNTQKVISKSRNATKYINLLRGVMSYARYLVKQKKCINLTTGIVSNSCTQLTSDGNLERLLITSITEQEMRQKYEDIPGELKSYYDAGNTNIGLDSMSFVVNKADIISGHPLYDVFRASNTAITADKAKFFYTRVLNPTGVDVTIKIRIVLISLNGEGEEEELAEAKSEQIFFPRQINNYSLVTQRHLKINGRVGETTAAGDDDESNNFEVNILPKNTKNIFYSPVFINNNLYIPSFKNANVNPGGENVIFKDSIYLAKHLRFYNSENEKEKFAPTEPGSEGNLYMSRYEFMSGAKAGIHRVKNEVGLERLFSKDSAAISTDSMHACIDYMNRKSVINDEDTLSNSRLVINKSDTNVFRIGLTAINEFIDIDHTFSNDGESLVYTSGAGSGVTNFTMNLTGGMTKTFEMGNGTTAVFDLELLNMINKPVPKDWYQIPGGTSTSTSGNVTTTVLEERKVSYIETAGKTTQKKVETRTTTTTVTTTTSTTPGTSDVPAGTDDDGNPTPAIPAVPPQTTTSDSTNVSVSPITIVLTDITTPKLHITTSAGAGKSVMNLSFDFTDMPTVNDDEAYPKEADTWAASTLTLEILAHNFRTNPGTKQDDGVDDAGIAFPSPKRKTRKIEFSNDGNHSLLITTDFTEDVWNALSPDEATAVTLTSAEAKSLGSEPFDFVDKCAIIEGDSTEVTDSSTSNYNSDYSDSAFTSWNYKPITQQGTFVPAPGNTSFDFDDGGVTKNVFTTADAQIPNALTLNASTNGDFQSQSVLDRCIVEPTATRVAGFLTCRYMKIKARNTDLKMVGTFIVDKLEIDSSITATISWYSIFHPMAREELEELEDMGAVDPPASCKINTAAPLWFTRADATLTVARECEPSILTEIANPYKWSTFSPLCGLNSAADIITTCKPSSRAYAHYVLVINEDYGQ